MTAFAKPGEYPKNGGCSSVHAELVDTKELVETSKVENGSKTPSLLGGQEVMGILKSRMVCG